MTDLVHKIAFTRGDHATLPGGVILREIRPGEFAAHHFSRDKGQLRPNAFFWGTYGSYEFAARAFNEKLRRVNAFQVTKAQILKDQI